EFHTSRLLSFRLLTLLFLRRTISCEIDTPGPVATMFEFRRGLDTRIAYFSPAELPPSILLLNPLHHPVTAYGWPHAGEFPDVDTNFRAAAHPATIAVLQGSSSSNRRNLRIPDNGHSGRPLRTNLPARQVSAKGEQSHS